jgi:uncharacterized protein DUF4265
MGEENGIKREYPQIKVVFKLAAGNDPQAETMFADDLGGGTYRLDNVPDLAYGVSLGDVFTTYSVEDDNWPYFERVIRRSENWTYRLIKTRGLSPQRELEFKSLFDRLRRYADYVSSAADEGWYALNVPNAQADDGLDELARLGEREGLWQWEISSGPDLG